MVQYKIAIYKQNAIFNYSMEYSKAFSQCKKPYVFAYVLFQKQRQSPSILEYSEIQNFYHETP